MMETISNFTIPVDITRQEVLFLEIVKQNMLKKLDDRSKFIFVYCFELGYDQRSAADVLGVHETRINAYIKGIRKKLIGFKK